MSFVDKSHTCLPCSAALSSAVMMGLSLLVRYSVALMAATDLSAAASSTNRCVLEPKLWYGCCIRKCTFHVSRKCVDGSAPNARILQSKRVGPAA